MNCGTAGPVSGPGFQLVCGPHLGDPTAREIFALRPGAEVPLELSLAQVGDSIRVAELRPGVAGDAREAGGARGQKSQGGVARLCTMYGIYISNSGKKMGGAMCKMGYPTTVPMATTPETGAGWAWMTVASPMPQER